VRTLLKALKRAAELSGRPEIAKQEDIDSFVKDALGAMTLTWSEEPRGRRSSIFSRRLRDDGRQFIFKAIARDNFDTARRR
jgi:hypothetical protein